MTDAQKEKFIETLLKTSKVSFDKLFSTENEFHHGDCIGADVWAGGVAYEMGFLVVTHPPINESKRAYASYNVELPAKPYLDRNHDIVDQTDMLIATPKEVEEQLRSGTWVTIRYALKKRPRIKPVILIFPDGMIVEHRGIGDAIERKA